MHLDLAGGCADRGDPRSTYRAGDGGAHPKPASRQPLAGALPAAGGRGLAGPRGVAGRTEAAATFKHRLDYSFLGRVCEFQNAAQHLLLLSGLGQPPFDPRMIRMRFLRGEVVSGCPLAYDSSMPL